MIQLYNDDCYEKIKDIPDNSVDLVIIDPPYLFNDGIGGGAFGVKKRPYHLEYYAMLKRKGHADEETERLRIKANSKRIRDNIASLSSGFDYSILDELCRVQERINAYVWCSKSQLKDLFNYYDDKRCAIDLLTWHKTNPTPLCNNTYLSDTEYCVFVRQRGVKLYGNYHTKRKYWVTPANVADKKRYGGHPTIKPQEIIENLITNSSERGGVVLDCFMGSGTTGAAAKKLGRSFIGIELDKKYFDIAKERIDAQHED
jgi:DNA modification methylase